MSKPIPLPAPVELGFSEKFQSWRDDQLLAIDRTINSPKRFIGACAPTGFGKTLYGVATALLHPEVRRAAYLTSTRGLQDQIAADFVSVGLCDIRGARNYPCEAVNPGRLLSRYRRHRGYVGCDEGPCHSGVRCPLAPDRAAPYLRPDCTYYRAVFDARNAGLVSTNYAFQLAQSAYGQGLGHLDLLILDEAHQADKELETFLTFEITVDDVSRLRTKLLGSTEISHWKEWGNHHAGALANKIEERELMPPVDSEGVTEMRKLKAILTKLDRLKDLIPTDWIVEIADGKRAKFSPIQVHRYAEKYLFCGVKKIILTSATLTRKTLQLLGIPYDQCELMEFKSSFDPARRPVIAVSSVQVNARMHETQKTIWMRRIDRFIEARRDRCGIIHAVSYARAKEIFTLSEHKDLMIWHESDNTRNAVEEFKRRADEGTPAILVSPSIMTGYDFPHHQCRYQIIAKVPIPDMRGPIMEIRKQQDKELTYYIAMQNLVQAVGRGTRTPDDWCETVIVDDTFGDWFWHRGKKHAAKWFHDSVEFMDDLPKPLETVLEGLL